MHKVRFKGIRAGGDWDGNTLPVNWTPTWEFTGGFEQATFPTTQQVGKIPADLYSKAPASDPYLLIATMWTDRSPTTDDIMTVDTRAPTQRRDRWLPFPGNTHVSLVRPDDFITFTQVLGAADDMFLELLIEPLANTNEFGEVLLDFVRNATAERLLTEQAETEITLTGNTVLSPWAGILRVTATAGAAAQLTLPNLNSGPQQLRDLLIIDYQMAQPLQVIAPAGSTINNAASIVITTANTSIWIRGKAPRYNAVGVL